MPTIQITSHVSIDELLQGVEKLSLPELEQFVFRVLALQAKRKAPSLPKDEARLLAEINQGLPPETQKRLNELSVKRREESLTPDEHNELLELIDHIEKSDATRMELLAELARLRQTSLTSLMKDLGMRTPAYA